MSAAVFVLLLSLTAQSQASLSDPVADDISGLNSQAFQQDQRRASQTSNSASGLRLG